MTQNIGLIQRNLILTGIFNLLIGQVGHTFICSKGFFAGLILGGAYFQGGVSGGNLAFQNGLGLTIKTAYITR